MLIWRLSLVLPSFRLLLVLINTDYGCYKLRHAQPSVYLSCFGEALLLGTYFNMVYTTCLNGLFKETGSPKTETLLQHAETVQVCARDSNVFDQIVVSTNVCYLFPAV